MDPAGRWQNLPSGPSLKHLTDPSYGIPREQQKPALQELTRAHVESFNYAVREGLSHAVQVSAASSQAPICSASLGAAYPCAPRDVAKLQAGRGEGPRGAGAGRWVGGCVCGSGGEGDPGGGGEWDLGGVGNWPRVGVPERCLGGPSIIPNSCTP